MGPPMTIGRLLRTSEELDRNLRTDASVINYIINTVGDYPESVTATSSTAFYSDGLISHFGQIRHYRKQFKELSKEKFREMSKTPVIKDILTGSYKMTQEEKEARIKEHLDNIE